MQKKSITRLYHTEIQKLTLCKTVTWKDMKFSKIGDRVQCQIYFKYQRPGETFCTCGSILQGITEEVNNQAEQRINSRFIMYVHGILQLSIEEYLKGRRYGNFA